MTAHEPFFGRIGAYAPRIAPEAFVAPGAVVVGRVVVGAYSSIWYGCVLRAEEEEVVIGSGCNVQDLTVMHSDPGFPAVLGDRVSVGHRAIVHGAVVERDSLVGMGATLLNGVVLGSGSVVAAGAVVPPGMEVPRGVLVAGVPARVVRDVRETDTAMIPHTHATYLHKSRIHADVEALRREDVSGTGNAPFARGE